MSFFNRRSDAKLEEESQRTRTNFECASSVREIDTLINDLSVFQQFISRDRNLASQMTGKLMNHAIVNYSLPIRPFLRETRVAVSGFLQRFYAPYDPDNQSSVQQALFNVAADRQVASLVQLLQGQINSINARRY